MLWKSINFCPTFAPPMLKSIKKPIIQAINLDIISFYFLDYLTASLSALPALNAGTFDAAILISAPV